MKKILKKTPIILALLLIYGCCQIETYDSKPEVIEQSGITFTPRVYTFTKSYSQPECAIYLDAQKETTITVKKAVLVSATRSHKSEVSIEKEIQINRLTSDQKSYSAYLKLFDENNTDLELFWNEGTMYLKIFYVDPHTGEIKEINFELKHRAYKDIAWPT